MKLIGTVFLGHPFLFHITNDFMYNMKIYRWTRKPSLLVCHCFFPYANVISYKNVGALHMHFIRNSYVSIYCFLFFNAHYVWNAFKSRIFVTIHQSLGICWKCQPKHCSHFWYHTILHSFARPKEEEKKMFYCLRASSWIKLNLCPNIKCVAITLTFLVRIP